MAELEKVMEDKLIAQLTTGISQWTLREDLRTEDDLWNNLRQKLNQNNLQALDGVLITDKEMDAIKEFIKDQGMNPYKAAEWLSGERGIAQIPLLREDAAQGTVYLTAMNNREIAGGGSSYEIIHQYQAAKSSEDDRARRYDVTLLINGLPMIHIELKNQNHPFMDAFRQIKKYSAEGKFSGIFGLVQMFVVSNGTESRYIAAARADELNENFLTKWVDEHNEPQDNYLDFAREALNVPRAHEIIGRYSVLDDVRKKVILLRPYQIHAIEKVKQASSERKSGYIWHTTGSGKTLTSFNVTRNLLDIPSIDKAIFLIDRRDLDKQTADSFTAYAAHSNLTIDKTDSTWRLRKLLESKDRSAIVTTIQKLQALLRWCERGETDESDDENAEMSGPQPVVNTPKAAASTAKQREKFTEHLKNLQVAFVVDECHRAVSPQSMRQIQKFFDKPSRPSLWYGFTGTPLFAENKSTAKGDLPRITEDQYGPCLHSYTVKEAIHDHAVLGFQLNYQGLDEEHLKSFAAELEIKNYQDMAMPELERRVEKSYVERFDRSIYDNREHKKQVVDYIINKCRHKFNLGEAESGKAYEALLTCESIKDAQEYYELFCEFKDKGWVKENIRELCPDFPKVAITYTVGENEDGADVNQSKMAKSLQDYNAMFGTAFSLENGLDGYNSNLNDRLARKTGQYKKRSEQLDLVIVVDRLLTGFDAPCLALLFIDRKPMSPQGLVQALSRTNRLFDNGKKYGQIMTMQSPYLFAEKIDKALFLYSHGGTKDVSAPTFIQAAQKLTDSINKLRAAAENPDKAGELTEKEELTAFVKAVQAVDNAMSGIKTYDEFDEERLKEEFGLDKEEFEEYLGRYQNALERLKELNKGDDDGDEPDPIDLEMELSFIKQTEVSYKYLIELIQRFVPEEEAKAKEVDEANDERINKLIKELSAHNSKMGGIIADIWQRLKDDPRALTGQSIALLASARANDEVSAKADAFAKKWGINRETIIYAAMSSKTAAELNPDFDYDAYKAGGGSLSKLAARRTMRAELDALIENELKPLLQQGQY
ncbi:MAG: type I restriction endonuclease subunit R [Proteobacteria bacterium]|uniref:type I site-specific deoxyribonuclease n=1 Tax=Candidatus Avisuccinivibrio stercorigallinarum TaxID=2840704 RepID=A0A9D9DCP2_9GAMM|nr:type I restriction endonuclease subunit R [Candidatus Avisuccinivibrio stercorigallinarum]